MLVVALVTASAWFTIDFTVKSSNVLLNSVATASPNLTTSPTPSLKSVIIACPASNVASPASLINWAVLILSFSALEIN